VSSPFPPLVAWIAVVGLGAAGVLLIFLVVQLRARNAALWRLNRTLDELAHIDPLTRLRNRRAIEQLLVSELSSSKRHDHPVSVLLADVDNFKQINDTLGHHAGDVALEQIATALERSLRIEDALGRWGGEEFLAVLRFTDEEGAVHVAERLRSAVAHTGSGARSRSITIGVAQWRGESLHQLLMNADRALYAGKLAGRDLVSVASAVPTTTEGPAATQPSPRSDDPLEFAARQTR
jgi:diguanylate cyclase (GGDEF)-like protein